MRLGERPAGADDHLEIPSALPSLPQTVSGVAKLALRRYASVQLEAPAMKAALGLLGDRPFDLVVANEARALPLAFQVAGDPRVWCDLHEWAPEERTHVLSWRLLVSPFIRWMCGRYLPRVDAATTINDSIAGLYRDQFGVECEIVRNAIAHRTELRSMAPLLLERTLEMPHERGTSNERNQRCCSTRRATGNCPLNAAAS